MRNTVVPSPRAPGRALTHLSIIACVLALGCGDDVVEPTYANVADTIETSCGSRSSSCHGGARGSAGLNFQLTEDNGMPYTAAMNGIASCQYDRMPIIDPGNPGNSWLMVKLNGDFDADSGELNFEPDADWAAGVDLTTDGFCPLVEDGELKFGQVMPQNRGAPAPLSAARIEMFRAWIEAGAPSE